jgi:hypothetical protein
MTERKYKSNTADSSSWRNRLAQMISGSNFTGDTLHQIALDFGYPETLTFTHFWNMYRRFGIAKNVIELPPDTTWMTAPTIKGSEQFNSDLDKLNEQISLWVRLKGLDTRQRVGRYAGMFMRVRDNKEPSQPLEKGQNGVASLVQMVPLYEGQLKVLETQSDAKKDDFGLPTMYQFNSGDAGNRNEKAQASFSIHPSRIIIAAEGADNGGIYGVPALEAIYNSLMDLRKIIGAGGEGFYKNAAQSIVFELQDAASASANAELLGKFNDQFDEFSQDRSRRGLWTPGLTAKTLESMLANPKEFFMNALNDVAAGSSPMIPATILIGQQTGRLASNEDSRAFLSGINSRRENFATPMTRSVIDWMIEFGILPASEYTVEWDDLLALSDQEKLDNAAKMAETNQKQFQSGGDVPFSGEDIREAAGFDIEDMPEIGDIDEGGEDLDEDLDAAND